ncbi:folylpolyglutamate synthase/dihydrofolate synthase family protein [Olivibacter ginsenosidimutans]|uniref:Dihydrofolate synthase/folylpolyglutamate synthase n=1 Tax=Olivibacter ginsenosidimutans TaxID=1176537 RepID=A0ABP9AGZ9_9SPHI
MNYIEVLDYLYGRLPMFTRDGASAFKKDLTNTLKLCAALDDPHRQFRAIHVAGTNGKGSTSHMLAAILQCAGYRTGLYTSPHLLDFRERIQINGAVVPKDFVVDFVNRHQSLIEAVQPSFFEVTVAMAFAYFAAKKVDIAVIETGLGGRLDSTNVIHPLLSLITNIGYDHMHMLGNSLTAIAGEKAGIIKWHTPIVISERQDDIDNLFIQRAAELHAPIHFASDAWRIEKTAIDPQFQYLSAYPNDEKASLGMKLELQLDLRGSYQQKNVAGVLTSIPLLQSAGYAISTMQIQQGLRNVQQLTGLMGRWQTLATQPTVICDTGHNEDGWKEIIKNLAYSTYSQLHLVIGVMRDKDLPPILQRLPKEAIYYFCNPDFERALPAKELQIQALSYQLVGNAYTSIPNAIQAAQAAAAPDDLIFIGGSTFVVADALPLFM